MRVRVCLLDSSLWGFLTARLSGSRKVASALVKRGTLHRIEFLVAGRASGRVRVTRNDFSEVGGVEATLISR